MHNQIQECSFGLQAEVFSSEPFGSDGGLEPTATSLVRGSYAGGRKNRVGEKYSCG